MVVGGFHEDSTLYMNLRSYVVCVDTSETSSCIPVQVCEKKFGLTP